MNNFRIEIEYCTKCNWLMRSTWMAQELLSTFSDELDEVSLIPGDGGIFEIRFNDSLIWSREKMNGFPDIKSLKQLVRDQIAPHRDLGHLDK